MTGGEIAQIIVALATLITSLTAAIVGLRNSTKIDVIHTATNSMKDQLVAVTAASSKAEGNLEGRAELKAEQKKPA